MDLIIVVTTKKKKKRSTVAIIASTKISNVVDILIKITLQQRNLITRLTLDRTVKYSGNY
jgi:hypothetical protein